MKIFHKSHLWKDNRTFIELEAEEPMKERGYANEGHILVKIGQQSSVKSAFKLSVDEARGLRDSIDMFLRFHDMKLSELMTEQKQQFEKIPDFYPRTDTITNNEKEEAPLFIFDTAEPQKTRKEDEHKHSSEIYF